MSNLTATRVTAGDVVRARLEGRRFDLGTRLFELVVLLGLLASLLVLIVLLVDVFQRGWGVYVDRGLDFVTSPLSRDPEKAGIGQALVGSLTLLLFVALLAFPLGIGAAIYLEEYAADNALARFINTNIRNLAGVPSIVYGLLGLGVFVVALGDITGPRSQGRSVISGGLTLAIVVLPIVIITAAEALRAVPGSIREAGYGVGATRWQVVRHHVLPYAMPGILTGSILSLSRAFGETAPLVMVGGAVSFLSTGGANFFEGLFGPYTALPATIYRWARLPQAEFRELTAAAIIALLGVILLINAFAVILRNRYARRW